MGMSDTAKAPRLPIEILEIIIQDFINGPATGALANLCKFRLVCKSFAEAGLPYITHKIQLVRLPAAFDRVDEVANHATARFHVRILICNGRPFNPPPDKHQPRFQNGEDVIRFGQLVKKLPNLNTLQLDCFQRKPPSAKTTNYPKLSTAIFGRRQQPENEGEEFVDLDILEALHEASNIDYLILSRIDLPTMWHFPAEGFSTLRKLSIWIIGQRDDTRLLPSLIQLHSLEVFEFRYSDLDFIRWSFKLPPRLKCLGLSGVELLREEFPLSLDELCLHNVRIVGEMTKWADVFLHLPQGCKLFLLGPIVGTYSQYGWFNEMVTPGDPIFHSTLSQVLSEVCSAPRKFDDGFRQALLWEIFGTTNNVMRHISSPIRKISVSAELTEIYSSISHPPPTTELELPHWAFAMN